MEAEIATLQEKAKTCEKTYDEVHLTLQKLTESSIRAQEGMATMANSVDNTAMFVKELAGEFKDSKEEIRKVRKITERAGWFAAGMVAVFTVGGKWLWGMLTNLKDLI